MHVRVPVVVTDVLCNRALMICWLKNVAEVSSEVFMTLKSFRVYFLQAGKYFKDVYDRTDEVSINI